MRGLYIVLGVVAVLAGTPVQPPTQSSLAAAQAAALRASMSAGKAPTGKAPTGKAPTGKAPTGKAPGKAPTGKAPAGKAPTMGKALSGKGRPPVDYDYDYAYAPLPSVGQGKAPTPKAKAPTGKTVIGRPVNSPQSNISATQAAALKPETASAPAGPNDYDYDYITNANGQKVPRCICPHEWAPVCGVVAQQGAVSRVTFPNRCQALCHTNAISLGVCPGDSETYQKCTYEKCQADDINPICVYNTDFQNICTINCQFDAMGLPHPPLDIMYSGPCHSDCLTNKTACAAGRICWPKPGKCFEPPCYNYKCVDPTCSNPNKCGTTKFDLVCANGVTYTNECWANCEGYFNVKKGACPVGQRDPWFPRVIPHDPIARGLPDPLATPTPAIVPLRCVPGLFLNGTACFPCPSGSTSPPAATNCTPCAPGTYAPARGSAQCLPCPNGTFTGTVGSSTCQACTPPFITTRSGSVTCQLPPLSLYGRSEDCNVDDPCLCAQLVGDCGWSSSFSKCMKDKDTDCKECPKMNVCRDSINSTNANRKPPAVRDLAVTESQAQMLKVQWVQPIKNFVCNVDMYKVQLRKEDGPWQLVEWPSFGIYGIDPVIRIGGLTPSTGYTLMVTPVSLQGGEGEAIQVPARTANI